MQIEQRTDGDLLELTVSGALDNDSSHQFRNAIDERVRDGWHRIIVHMPGVRYVSSAGISVLIATSKRLAHLQGQFGICALTPDVESILERTRLLEVLRCDPERVRAAATVGNLTRSLSARIARVDGLDLQIFTLSHEESSRCSVIGDPQPLFESAYAERDCHTVDFPDRRFALGLGALGHDAVYALPRCGEFLAAAGAVAQSAQSRRSLPDYSVLQGELTARAQVLYGLQWEGGFTQLIRFDPVASGAPTPLSTIISRCLRESRCRLAGVVILAESAGLLGCHLRRSPAMDVSGTVDRFQFPDVREWLSFSPDRVYSRNLVLIVGIAKTPECDVRSTALELLLRPLNHEETLHGHVHAAVFPYRPLKKRTLDLHSSVRGLFESGDIQDVLHLLRDDRPIVGAGESELLGGACWVSPISDVADMEGRR